MTLQSFVHQVRRVFARQEPLITVSISRERLLANLRAYQERYPKQAVAPVLKSNAYGHGLSLVASVLDREDIAFLMVDSLFEARKLRRDGIRAKIVVMGYVRPEQIASCRLRDIEFAITDIEQLRTLSASATRRSIRACTARACCPRSLMPQSRAPPRILSSASPASRRILLTQIARTTQ